MLRRTWRLWVAFSPIFMPSLSPSMEHGRIVEWKKKVGDEILEGDVWCTVETDKATVDFTNTTEIGFLAALYVQNGEKATVGKTIAVIVEDRADVGKGAEYVVQDAAEVPTPAPPPPPSIAQQAPAPPAKKRYGSSIKEAIAASGPGVARVAATVTDHAVLESVVPTGKGGRFLKTDFAHLPNFEYSMSPPVDAPSATAAPADPPTQQPAPAAIGTKKLAPAPIIQAVSFIKPFPVTNFSVSDTNIIRKLAAAYQRNANKKKLTAEEGSK